MAPFRGDTEEKGLRLRSDGDPTGISPVPAFVGCAVGTFFSGEVPVLGILLLSFSMRFLMWEGRPRRFVLPLLALALGAVAFAAVDIVGLTLALPALIVALGVCAGMAQGRATVLNVSLVVVAGALAGLVVDTGYAAMYGTTAREALSQVFETYMRASLGSGIEEGLAVNEATALFNVLWPFVYVVQSASYAAIAGLGCVFLETRFRARRFPSVAAFDAPLWAVGVLAASALAIAASFADTPASYPLSVVGATALMSVRIIFALQGFGVVASRLSGTRTGCVLRGVIVLLLFWAETVFMAMSIVGLIDVWANFRKLPREGSGAASADS